MPVKFYFTFRNIIRSNFYFVQKFGQLYFFLEQINKVGRVSGLVNTSLPFADDVLLLA